jgi:hypothetical protein
MHLTLHFAFLLAALVLGILATLNVPSLPRFTWGWGSLTTLIIAMFFT